MYNGQSGVIQGPGCGDIGNPKAHNDMSVGLFGDECVSWFAGRHSYCVRAEVEVIQIAVIKEADNLVPLDKTMLRPE